MGIQYEPSILVAAPKENSPAKLVLGQRLPPKVVLRAVDATPVEIQDMCPSDTRFKVLVFTGDISQSSQSNLLRKFAKEVFKEGSLVKTFGSDAFDILTIIKGEKETVNYLEIPVVLRTHYSKYVFLYAYRSSMLNSDVVNRVLLDAVDVTGKEGGKIYEEYGIRPEGDVVVVRPDGYVASITRLDRPQEVEAYFANFLEYEYLPQRSRW